LTDYKLILQLLYPGKLYVAQTKMNKVRFDVRLDPDAAKEYQNLDNSVVEIVDKAIDELEFRADEVGKSLGNMRDIKLAGCKEIKLRDAGIRIIFRITNEIVEVLRVVYIIAIEKRSADFVFKIASKRFSKIKKLKYANNILEKGKKWTNSKNKN
jgi:mRNA interferase RelE/StbE